MRRGSERAVDDDALCPACGTSDARPFAALGAFSVCVCSRCGLGRTVPQPSDAALAALYAGERPPPVGSVGVLIDAARTVFADAFAARVARRVGRGRRVLDIGCGDGKVLAALARRGYACQGVDLNPAFGGTAVHRGTLEDARFPARAFDVVIVRHALEHVRDPVATLREIRRVTADDGHLAIAVPNLASWQARATTQHWLHLDVPRHLWHFTPAALTAMVVAAGFDVVRVAHLSLEHNAYGWLQSGFAKIGGRWRAFHEQLRARTAAPISSAVPPIDRVVAVVAALLVAPCSVLAVMEAVARRGGTIELWARVRPL